MKRLVLTKDELTAWVRRMTEGVKVFAPVAVGDYDEFRLVDSDQADLIRWSYQNTRLSPKGLFHPQAERMFKFSTSKEDPEWNILKEVPKDFSPRVIVGMRPCDAAALKIMDVNFDTPEYKDPWWVRRRKATTIVGLACTSPSSTCFCTSVNSGPFDTKGLDVLLVPLGGGRFLLEVVSERGEELCQQFGPGGKEADSEAIATYEELKKKAEAALVPIGDLSPFKERDMLEFFNSPIWDEVQFACINCGVCTYLCPTCWCFDIQDEVYESEGCRLRLWDSCMFPLFTLHGSGHNPRAEKLQRVRQRFMHKLKYYVDKYGQGVACVGCGRCVQFCPVNIDIREVIRLMLVQCECAV